MKLALSLAFVALLLACNGPKARSAADAGKSVSAGTPGFDLGKFKSSIEVVAKDLAKDPCNKQKALQLGDFLNRAGDSQAALAHVAEFQKACGDWPRLLWVAQYAQEQSGAWKGAVETGAQLIRSEPSDSDFWWWRGQANWHAGEFAQAEVDFFQSMANKPTGYPAARFTGLAREHAQYACPAALLLQYLVEQSPKNAGDWAAKDRTELWLKGDCGTWAGTGKAVIATPRSAPLVTVPVVVNGKKATFMVEADLGPTLVSKQLAEQAAIGTSSERGPSVWFAGDFKPASAGKVASFKVGGAEVKGLNVLSLAELPPGIDGVLGLSTLVRFSVKVEPDRITLAALPK
jgi:hypothetical protein